MSVLITAVKIIDPGSTYHGKKKNVLIQKGKIEYIGSDTPKATKILSGKGCLLSAGWFDLKANFCDPGLENKEDIVSGIAVAVAGGFTEVALVPNTEPVIQSKNDIRYLLRLNKSSLVQIRPLAAVTKNTAGQELTEMLDMQAAGAAAFTDGNKHIWNTDILLKAIQYVQKFDGLVIDQPQDKWLSLFGTMNEGVPSTLLGMKGIPAIAEEIAVARDIEVLNYTGGKLHLSNLSTAGAVDLVRKAKKSGLKITCDVAAHQLVFVDEQVAEFDTNFKVNPPLRTGKDVKALIKGLKDGTIDAIVSAHEPHDVESKKLEFDHAEFGMLGLQTVLPFLMTLNEKIHIEKLIPKLTSQPRSIIGLAQPVIKVGEEANLTLFNPQEQWEYNEAANYSKSENSPVLGQTLTGKVVAVFNNGQEWLA
jgi:dihydroorotase